MILTAVVYKSEQMFVSKCVEVGTVSQGYTVEEALANLKEATELYLEEFPLEKQETTINPMMTNFEVSESVKA